MNFYATFRPVVGGPSLEVPLGEGATVGDLVAWLVERYPELGEKLLDADGGLSRHAHVFVDGRSARWLERGLETPIGPAQKLDIFPAVAGG